MIAGAEAAWRGRRSSAAAPIVRVGRRQSTGVWLAFLGIGAGAFAYLMIRGRGNIFVYDEWGWIEFRRSGVSSILSSYNDHVLVVPLAVYQALFRTVGLGDYTVYRVLAALAHLACVAATFEFARRRIGAAALLIAVPLAFFGPGWEYEMEGVNFGFTLSIALGIGALLALDSRGRRADVTACALLTVGVAFSEFAALFALGIAIGQIAADRNLRRAWIWVVPLVVYGIWWIAYYEPIASQHDLGAAPKFAADMVASAAGGLFGAGLQRGRVILLLIVALIGWRVIRRHALTPVLITVLVTAVAFWVLVAVGRDQLNKPWASHYVYTGAILLVLVVSESLRGVRIDAKVLALAAALAVLSVVGSVRSLRGGEAYLRTASQNVRAELGALRLLGPAAPATLTLDNLYAPQLIVGPYLAAARMLGPAPTDSPRQLARRPETARLGADDFLLRAGELQTRSLPTPVAPAANAPSVEQATNGTTTTSVNCVTFRPDNPSAVVALLLPPAGLRFQPQPGTGTVIRARRFATGFDPTPITASTSTSPLTIRSRSDQSPVPWHIQIATPRTIRICTPA